LTLELEIKSRFGKLIPSDIFSNAKSLPLSEMTTCAE